LPPARPASAVSKAPPGRGFLPSKVECDAKQTGANTNLDCDDPISPNNEPDIEVDPTDPDHMVASSNDYDSNGDQFYTTFDGGQSWTTGDMSRASADRTGSDPVTSFDPKHDTVIHTSLSYLLNKHGVAVDGDLVASISTDGGVTWGDPVTVAGGSGTELNGIFNDKPWVVTDTNPDSDWYGRTYVTWSRFLSRKGTPIESPIFEAHSDDGGHTWTAPKEISGVNAAFCTFQEQGPAGQCDEDQFSVPTVGPDGTLTVAFENDQHQAAWEPGDKFESQYLVVQSRDGGATFSQPVHVVDLEDGTRDYPLSVLQDQTLSGVQFRVNSAGDVVASPNDGRLFLVFSDNRAGVHDVPKPVTNTNVYLMTSEDGSSWQGPFGVDTGPGDQWFPWVDINAGTDDRQTGTGSENESLGVIYHDRPGRDGYDTTLATGSPPEFKFELQRVSNARSHPNDALVFQAGVPRCPKCTVFIGDYIELDYGSDGRAHLVWTDMRRRVSQGQRSGFTENIFYATVP
jgi:hypothetical protein